MPMKYMLYEMKKWVRDPMFIFLLVYSPVLALVVRFGLPFAEEQFGFPLEAYYHVVLAVLMLITALLTGAIIGFSVLDDRDDKILYAVDVSPVSFNSFMGFRFSMSFLLTLITSLTAAWITGLAEIAWYILVLVTVSISLFSSITAMAINCLSRNKVEGFAMMKALGMIIVVPAASLFFTDAKEFLFSFEPNFWAVKALSTVMLPNASFNLGFWGYYLVGLVYVIVLNLVIFKVFKRRIMV